MNRYLYLKVLVVLLAMCAEIAVLMLLASCSFNPPPNTGAYGRGLTETNESKAPRTIKLTNAPLDRMTVGISHDEYIQNQMRLNERMVIEPRPAPVALPQSYRYYTNSAEDALLEKAVLQTAARFTNAIPQPPLPPGYGPFQVQRGAPAVSNWMTPKAMAVQPKPLGTNQIPGSFVLTKITTTDKDGKLFTAELTLEGNSRIQATDKMAVIIFSINTENWIIESCTNLIDGKWYPMASGTGGNTNAGALVIVDLKEDSAPIKFYRQRKQP